MKPRSTPPPVRARPPATKLAKSRGFRRAEHPRQIRCARSQQRRKFARRTTLRPDDRAAGAARPRATHVAMIDDTAERATAASEPALRLEDFLPYRLNVCSNLVSSALSRIYAERYRIGVPEWRVLVTLGQFGMMTAKAIGAHSC